MNPDAAWKISLIALVGSFILFLFSITYADVDLWGHLRFGLDNLESGEIAQVDRYSYMSDGQRWVNHEWLSEVLLALAWRMGGTPGLVILKMLLGLGTLGLVILFFKRCGMGVGSGSILLLAGSLLLAPDMATVRPQVFTILCFAGLLFLVVEAESGAYRRLWWAVPLLLVWANLHGGVLAGATVLSVWAVVHVFLNRAAWKQVAVPVALSLAGLLVNPYGAALPVFLLRTATVPRPEIWEWNPLELYRPIGILYVLVVVAAILGFVSTGRKRSIPLVVLFAGIATGPLLARRHLSLFSIGALMIAGQPIAARLAGFWGNRSRLPKLPVWLAGVPALGALALLAGAAGRVPRIPIPTNIPLRPFQAVSLLQSVPDLKGNLATEFSWGEYVLWHLGPRVKVSIDGRRETLYSEEIYQQNLHFLFGREHWDEVLSRHPTDMVLVLTGWPAYNLILLHPGWVVIHKDDASTLFARQGTELESKLRKAAGSFVPRKDPYSFP